MTSALQRGSNLEKSIKKVMLLPAQRMKQLTRKMKSPMFYERYEDDNWSIILFDVLYKQWDKDKTKTKIDDLFGQPTTIKKTKTKNKNQLNIFGNNDE